ncbi:methyltransferase MtaB domain-containing protein, partial [Methanosarcina sp. 2.H.T.1A.15]|uniref:methyltransferase MtaB domain-containing protein n=1 Tax=Methanosarcina sp. 2.H.T.1A.15 TaxID=1483596 RepID=UPI0028800DFE
PRSTLSSSSAASDVYKRQVEEGINSGKLRLTRFETNALAKVKADLVALTDDADKFMSESLTKYKQEVAVFRPENYGL